MLIVFCVIPVSAPLKTVLLKYPAAYIPGCDFIGEISASIHILSACRRFTGYHSRVLMYIGIIQRINIHRKPQGVQRQPVGSGNAPVAKRRRIIVFHRGFITGSIFVNQTNFFYGILQTIQLLKDMNAPFRDFFINN